MSKRPPLTAVQKKRLLNVARACRETKSPIDMKHYVHPCGSPACPFGNYVARRDLQRTFRIVNGEMRKGTRPVGYGGWQVLNHFGINSRESERLFSPKGCGNARTAGKAARFIERFVESRS